MRVSITRVHGLGVLLVGAAMCNGAVIRRAASSITSDAASLDNTSYDYVIVGGGLTGLVAATRLSEDSSRRVLVVEAGGDTRNDAKVVSLAAYTQAYGDSRYDWSFPVAGKQFTMVQGLGLGGSSSINGAAFTLPPASQLDAIGTMGSGDDWNFAALQPYFHTYQNYHAPSSQQAARGVTANMSSHGTSGPIDIGFSDVMYTGPQETAFITAQQQALGAPKINDLGSGVSGGAAFIANTAQPNSGSARTRVSSATGYLTNAQNRGNLVVLTNTRATKMLYGSTSAPVTANGVQLQATRGGATYTVHASKVIVAAGAIRTPLFLQHSGIGDASLLQSLGITTQVNLPGVGKNFCEQQMNNVYGSPPSQSLGGASGSPSSAISMNTIGQLMNNASDVRTYIEANMDAWAQSAVDAGASASKSGLLLQYRTMVTGIFEQQWPVSETFFVPQSDTLLLQMWALLSFSRGYVQATSTSTWDAPKLDPRYWSAPIDMDMQVAANRATRKVMQSDAFKAIMNGAEVQPGFDVSNGGIPDGRKHGSFARWQSYIRRTFKSVAHPLGTAAMLPQSQGGVVDGKFKVYGTQNVFVIDASVLPMQQSTHLSGVLYAIAEKAAATLKRM